MGIFDDNKKNENACKLHDLICMAMADNEFSDIEKKYIVSIMIEEGIDEETLDKVMYSPISIKDSYPNTREDKIKYFVQLVGLMISDGECSEREIKFLNIIALKLGFNDNFITASLILSLVGLEESKRNDILLSYIANGGK
jgi:uncharacterized membrane protein YebE (DUF533 family)